MPPVAKTKLRRVSCGDATFRPLRLLMLMTLLLAVAASCTWRSDERVGQASNQGGGDPQRGRELIDRVGCGSCHVIPGIARARGRVGAPLGGIATRSYVGGALPNTPANMVAWIQHPQRIDPATAMPDLGLSDAEARDVATYLYTLR